MAEAPRVPAAALVDLLPAAVAVGLADDPEAVVAVAVGVAEVGGAVTMTPLPLGVAAEGGGGATPLASVMVKRVLQALTVVVLNIKK